MAGCPPIVPADPARLLGIGAANLHGAPQDVADGPYGPGKTSRWGSKRKRRVAEGGASGTQIPQEH